MGCLKRIVKFILFIIFIWAFVHFGGFDYVREKYYEYTNPDRQTLFEEEADFGDFTKVPESYKLTRTLSVGKYRKINAKHSPSGQKIAVIDTGSTEFIDQNDFYTKQIDKKLEELLGMFKNSFLTPNNVQITQRGTLLAKGKIVPYIDFSASIKNVPFLGISGTVAGYTTINKNEGALSKLQNTVHPKQNKPTTKIIVSIGPGGSYKPEITKNFIKYINFKGL